MSPPKEEHLDSKHSLHHSLQKKSDRPEEERMMEDPTTSLFEDLEQSREVQVNHIGDHLADSNVYDYGDEFEEIDDDGQIVERPSRYSS